MALSFTISPLARRAAIITVGIWLYTALMAFLPSLVATGHPAEFLIPFYLSVFTAAILLSILLYRVVAAVQGWKTFWRLAVVGFTVIIVSAILGFFDAFLHGEFLKVLMPLSSLPRGVVGMAFANFVGFSWLFGLLGAVYLILQSNEALRIREAELQEARLEARVAQLSALRLQINPHFLFNTLNAISSLIVTRKNKDAEATLNRLSQFLRTTLTNDHDDCIALEDELEILQNYMEVEAIRFRDRLLIEFTCPDKLLKASVPSFILQPLVENAIKYAVSPSSGWVTIHVEIYEANRKLVMSVRDSGADQSRGNVKQGLGVGLANVRRRLDVLYGNDACLKTASKGNGFEAVIAMPLTLVPVMETVT